MTGQIDQFQIPAAVNFADVDQFSIKFVKRNPPAIRRDGEIQIRERSDIKGGRTGENLDGCVEIAFDTDGRCVVTTAAEGDVERSAVKGEANRAGYFAAEELGCEYDGKIHRLEVANRNPLGHAIA